MLSVQAELETDDVLSAGDAADDPAIWISPNDLNQSLIVATDERAGLCSFDLERRVVRLIIAGRHFRFRRLDRCTTNHLIFDGG